MTPPDPECSPTGPTFAMLGCANGAEAVVKAEVQKAGWRLAFSRPGFVTVKHDEAVPLPRGIFIRTASHSIGSGRGEHSIPIIEKLRADLKDAGFDARPLDHLHVWPRDRLPIGKFDFEPEIDPLSRAVAGEIFTAVRGEFVSGDAANLIAQADQRVLDVVLVEPGHWFWGWHVAGDWPSRWPGALQPISPQHEPISRAYYKAAEAIVWSGFHMQAGDSAVEVGSAPGGACGRLLELGLNVIGIDPAAMDPRIGEHPRYRHITARAGDLKRSEFRGVKWMLVDSNVKPDQTLSTVENIVTHPGIPIEGILLTLKLGDYERADQIDRWLTRVRQWNPSDVRVRQLARNKCEICIAIRMR